MNKARVIYNPSAGREVFKKKLPQVLEMLEKAGYETSCHATTGSKDATRAAEIAAERYFDLVVVAGGDGTVCEVVNGLACKAYRPQLGIIPAGTTNDYARAIGLPKDVEAACQVIINGRAQQMDIGRANKEYFINIAGGGSLTELTYEVPSKLKTLFGQFAYYAKSVEKLAFFKPTQMKIVSDTIQLDEEIMLFLITNSPSVGGFEKLAPNADMSDGYFDVLIIKKMNLPEFIGLATQVFRGEHVNDPKVIYFQTADINITSEQDVQLNLDGEHSGELPCHFQILKQHISVMVP